MHIPAPKNTDFQHFLTFLELLTDPKELKKTLDGLRKATKEYNDSMRASIDALAIAKTVDEAETHLDSARETEKKAIERELAAKTAEYNAKATAKAGLRNEYKKLTDEKKELDEQKKTFKEFSEERADELTKREDEVAKSQEELRDSRMEIVSMTAALNKRSKLFEAALEN